MSKCSCRNRYVPNTHCYVLRVNEVDRWSNKRVGMLEAVSTMPFKAVQIFKAEIATWVPRDYAHVADATGLNALIKIGLLQGR